MGRNRCIRCGTQKRPLKWYEFWPGWMCHQCVEHKVEFGAKLLALEVEQPDHP